MWNDKELTPKMKKLKASGDKEALEAYQRAFKRSIEYHRTKNEFIKTHEKVKSMPTKIVSKKPTKKPAKQILPAETAKLQKLVSPKKK